GGWPWPFAVPWMPLWARLLPPRATEPRRARRRWCCFPPPAPALTSSRTLRSGVRTLRRWWREFREDRSSLGVLLLEGVAGGVARPGLLRQHEPDRPAACRQPVEEHLHAFQDPPCRTLAAVLG